MPFVLAGLAHVEKEARALVMNQFIAHLGRKPSLDQVKVVVRTEKRSVHRDKCLTVLRRFFVTVINV